MKKILSFLVGMLILAVVLPGCDKIEAPYYEEIEEELVTVEFPTLDPSTVYRKILVEEFTGHRCVNCPEGHELLAQLQQQYGDTMMVVGIHYGPLAKPSGSMYSYDFRTETGTKIGEYYSIEAIPTAIFNMIYKEGGWPRTQWATVMQGLDRHVYAAIQMINEFDSQSNVLKANVKVTKLGVGNSLYRLALYLLEDGIVKPQKNGTEDIEDYVHNHVLRASLNGVFGTMLNDGLLLESGEAVKYAASIDMSGTDWVPENCYVVAVLSDGITDEVLQVEKLPVINR